MLSSVLRLDAYFNMGKNYFKINGFVGNIGEATGDWRRNRKFYERIQGIVMDTRYLMYHYSGKPLKEKVALAECIEAVMNKPLLPVGADALPEHRPVKYDYAPQSVMMVAEEPVPYGTKKDDH